MSSPEHEQQQNNSIRNKLLCWVLLPLICLCVLATVSVYSLAAKSASDSFDEFLLNSADSITARISRSKNGIVVADLPTVARTVIRHNGLDKFYYQIADSSGRRLAGDSFLPLPRETQLKEPKFRYVVVNGEALRMCRIPVDVQSASNVTTWVQVAETLQSRRKLLQQIFFSILGPQLALIGLASVSVWLAINRGLVSLSKLGLILKSRSKLDLSPVDLGKDEAIELVPVTDALNQLLSDADRHILHQRQFIANAAHQLRTPITALKTSVDHLARVSKDAETSVALKQIAQATDRSVHLINRLMSLARTTGNIAKQRESVDLTAVVDAATASLLPQSRQRGIELHFDIPECAVYVLGHQGDLEELVINLLDNAIKYTPESGCVWVRIAHSDQEACLIVEDTGPGIPDSEKPKVFERFYRGSQTSGFGCGLGLAIVSEIASSNHAKIELSDRAGGGAAFSVTFAV